MLRFGWRKKFVYSCLSKAFRLMRVTQSEAERVPSRGLHPTLYSHMELKKNDMSEAIIFCYDL